MKTFHRSFVPLAVLILAHSGCRHCCPTPPPPNDIASAYPPAPLLGYTPPHRLTPMETAPVAVSPAPQPPPAPSPATQSMSAAESGARLAVPNTGVPNQRSPEARLLPPESTPPSTHAVKPAVGEEPSAAANEPRRMPSMPVGIPQFAAVKDRVSAGLKPMLEGLDWLKTAGYVTVLFVRTPGSDDSADRREVEKRGMKYLSLEVSPATLTASVVEQFNRHVGDTAGGPLFIYDKDGVLSGGLWYLHFRTVDRVSDDVARTQAARLGLKEGATDEQRAMWLAIQRLLSSQGELVN